MSTISYTTREVVKAALDVATTARSDAQVDGAIVSATDTIHGHLHRTFYPEQATRRFNWPSRRYGRPWRLWLDQHDVISVDTLTAAGVVIPSTDFFLEPVNSGPPFTHIELDLDSSATFGGGSTHQQAVVVTGVFGYRNDEAPAGALDGAVNSSVTSLDVTDSSTVGVGSILRVESERMIVTGRGMSDTGQNLGDDMTAQANDVTVEVTDGAEYAVGEVLLVDSERMLIVDIAGNNLTVKRAYDGSVLATHSTGADIFAARALTVERGALGTTAAAHDDATALVRWTPPGLIEELAIAEALVRLGQKQAGYARTIGSGDSEREMSGRGLAQIREDAYTAHGRKARARAV